MLSAALECRYVRGVPQEPQNVRVTGGDDWKLTGSPCTNSKFVIGNVTHATTGEPAERRQVSQWQIILCAG
jgi:hypothetical protein